jgi:hypothetical protein
LEKERSFLNEVIKDPTLTDSDTINIEDAAAILNDIGRQFQFF